MTKQYPTLESITKNFANFAIKHIGETFWLARAKQRQVAAKYLEKLETIIVRMSNQERIKLKDKFDRIIPKQAGGWIYRYDDRFLDLVIEILGFGYLIKKKYDPSFTTTPDIVGYKKGIKVAAMECKNFWMSQCERDYLRSTMESVDNIKGRRVDATLTLPEFRNPFYRKLISVIDKATSHLSQLNENVKERIIFINFSFDVGAGLQREKIINDILKPEANRLRSCGITCIWFENYSLERILV